MIVSSEHRYVFVQFPRTGCTAIQHELREHYAGKPVLHKHSRYHEFLRSAAREERGYFAFGGIRHPMDSCVSLYHKLRSERYDDPANFTENGGWITAELRARRDFLVRSDADFAAYFRRYFRRPYDDWCRLAHDKFDAIIRFENIAGDFDSVLRRLGLEPVRQLPHVNKTDGRKKEFSTYFTPDIRDLAAYVFGPHMQRWGYSFPAEWGPVPVPISARIWFAALGPYRTRKMLRSSEAYEGRKVSRARSVPE